MKNIKKEVIIKFLLIFTIILGKVGVDRIDINAETEESMVTLYFQDNSQEAWVKNDKAVIELVDNTHGHIHYQMKKCDENLWTAQVPKSAYNITFNRMDEDKSVQWNSWSAGGRDSHNRYIVQGAEYGYWDDWGEMREFQEGDTIYLDISEYQMWTKDNAIFYINFSNVTKNDGKDISIIGEDASSCHPVRVEKLEDTLYSYTVTKEDVGLTELRFWRGDEDNLWNCSVEMTVDDYAKGMNMVEVTGWNETGYLTKREINEEVEIEIDTEQLEYDGKLSMWKCNQQMACFSGTVNPEEMVKEMEYQITDILGNQVKNGHISVKDEWKVADIGLVRGYNCITVSAITNNGQRKQEKIEIFNMEEENTKKIDIDKEDNDGDKLNNYQEKLFGTDVNKNDTDGDGLSDYEEIIILGTSPLEQDTNGDGMSDGESDEDKDGINNLEEIKNMLNPFLGDTDGDIISDGDELIIYGTEPLNSDTDGDGLLDGEEIKLGLNPKNKDTDEDGVLDDNHKIEQKLDYQVKNSGQMILEKVSVKMFCAGLINNSVVIKSMSDIDVFGMAIQGLIGETVEITSDVAFDNAKIIFEYNPEKLGDIAEEDLAIVWFDEENNKYELYDNDIILDKNNHTVSYETKHFSKYALVNKREFLEGFYDSMDYQDSVILEKEKDYDIDILVDISNSMISDKKIDRAREIIKRFSNIFLDSDNVGCESYAYRGFNSGLRNYSRDYLEYRAKNIKAGSDKPYMTSHGWSFDHNLKIGLETIMENFKNSESKNEQVAIIICDGKINYYIDMYSIDLQVQYAVENNIRIYVINVGDNDSEKFEEIAVKTGGKYLTALNAQDIDEIELYFSRVSKENYRDSDNDGLYDIYEKKGFMNLNGQIFYTDPYNSDTDGDGVSDYEEVGGQPYSRKYQIGDYTKDVVRNWNFKSNPTVKDTDRDGVNDLHDDNPSMAAEYYVNYEVTDAADVQVDNNIASKKILGEEKRSKEWGTGNYTKEEIHDIQMKYTIMMELAALEQGAEFGILSEGQAAKALIHYLGNTGNDFRFKDTKEFVSRKGSVYKEKEKELIKFFQNVLKDGESITVKTSNSFTSYDNNLALDKPLKGINWFLTLGTASGYVTATASRNGDNYMMEVRYIVYDYYDWNEGDDRELVPGISNHNMWEMTNLGVAKPYFIYGEYRGWHMFSKGATQIF